MYPLVMNRELNYYVSYIFAPEGYEGGYEHPLRKVYYNPYISVIIPALITSDTTFTNTSGGSLICQPRGDCSLS